MLSALYSASSGNANYLRHHATDEVMRHFILGHHVAVDVRRREEVVVGGAEDVDDSLELGRHRRRHVLLCRPDDRHHLVSDTRKLRVNTLRCATTIFATEICWYTKTLVASNYVNELCQYN